MTYKGALTKYPSLIDTETFIITNGVPKFKVDSDILGTTDVKSEAWQSYRANKTIQMLFNTIKYPVYHTITKEHHDMGYDSKREMRRCPVVDSIDLYIWSVSEGKPILYLYEVDTHGKSYYLRDTIKNRTVICSLSVEEDYEEEIDDTFAQVYQRISDILFTNSK